MSFGRAHRSWRHAGLQRPKKRSGKRVCARRPCQNAPNGPNQVWRDDVVHDWRANGQKIECLTVTDEFTKEGLAIEVDGRIRSTRVIDVLARLISLRGAPAFLRSDNGPEFVSRALLKWATEQKIDMALIDPGKPWQNGAAESFNGKFRDECLRDYGASARISALGPIGVGRVVVRHGRAVDHQGASRQTGGDSRADRGL